VHNPLPRYNDDENESTLSLFKGQRERSSGAAKKCLTNEEWRKIMLYVLMNLDEVDKYQGYVRNELVTYSVNFLHPTTLMLLGAGNFLIHTGIIQGHLLIMNERLFFNMVRLISLHGSKERYLLTDYKVSSRTPSCLISFLSCLRLQCQSDLSISSELRQVGRGFDYKVSSFSAYDVNGFRFHTTSYDKG